MFGPHQFGQSMMMYVRALSSTKLTFSPAWTRAGQSSNTCGGGGSALLQCDALHVRILAFPPHKFVTAIVMFVGVDVKRQSRTGLDLAEERRRMSKSGACDNVILKSKRRLIATSFLFLRVFNKGSLTLLVQGDVVRVGWDEIRGTNTPLHFPHVY
jgi:hypothetical protein